MIRKIKDNGILVFVSISIILLGSILLSLLTPVPNEIEIAEKIIKTEILTVDKPDDLSMWTSINNRVERIELDISLIKKALNEEPITTLIEKNNTGGTIINYPPKWRLELKSPSSLD